MKTTEEHEADASRSLDRLVRRLKRNATAINQVLKEAQKIWPEACLYLDGTSNLNLMSGPSHDDDRHQEARQDRVLGSARLDADGGDW